MKEKTKQGGLQISLLKKEGEGICAAFG